jgi:hypothetical protein
VKIVVNTQGRVKQLFMPAKKNSENIYIKKEITVRLRERMQKEGFTRGLTAYVESVLAWWAEGWLVKQGETREGQSLTLIRIDDRLRVIQEALGIDQKAVKPPSDAGDPDSQTKRVQGIGQLSDEAHERLARRKKS